MDKQRDFKNIIQNFAKDNQSVEQIKFLVDDDIEIEEMEGKGLVNYILRVCSRDKKQSVIIKYGETDLKVQVSAIPSLSLDRQIIEMESLKIWGDIHPGSVPVLYCYDKNHNIIAMEDLQDMEALGEQLQAGRIDLEIAGRVGKLLAITHSNTSRQQTTEVLWKHLEIKIQKYSPKEVQKDFLYIFPFTEDSPHTTIPEGGLEKYRSIIEQVSCQHLLDKIIALVDKSECLIHGDCNWKNMAFITATDRIVLFDFEFAQLGYPGLDLTCALVGYRIYCMFFEEKDESKQNQHRSRGKLAVKRLVGSYLEATELYKDSASQSELISNVALLTGGYCLALVVIAEFDSIIGNTAAKGNISMIESAGHLMLTHPQINTPDELADALFWEPPALGN